MPKIERQHQKEEESVSSVTRIAVSYTFKENLFTFAFAVLKIARASWGKLNTRFTLVWASFIYDKDIDGTSKHLNDMNC